MIFSTHLILGLFAINFTLGFILSVVVPIMLTLDGHNRYSFAAFFVYVVFSIALEFSFWLKSRKFLNKFSLNEKDWQREIFINDVVNLISGALARYDLYSDVIFVLITLCWGFRRLFIASMFFLLIKFTFKCTEFVKTFYKLFVASQEKENKSTIQIWNLIAKLAIDCDFLLMGDILDRYCPGNAKKLKKFLCWRLAEPKFISMGFLSIVIKFFLEDIPQTAIQIVFFTTKDNNTDQNKAYALETKPFCFMSGPPDDTKSTLVEVYLIINITRLVVSLLASFYAFASIRQSYIEQSDFDERIEDQRLSNSRESIQNHKKKKSVMKQRIDSLKSSKDLSKSVRDRMTMMTSKYLENIVRKGTAGENKIGIKKEEEGIEDFVNLAVNSIDSKEIELQEIDFMDSRVRLKKYCEEELI